MIVVYIFLAIFSLYASIWASNLELEAVDNDGTEAELFQFFLNASMKNVSANSNNFQPFEDANSLNFSLTTSYSDNKPISATTDNNGNFTAPANFTVFGDDATVALEISTENVTQNLIDSTTQTSEKFQTFLNVSLSSPDATGPLLSVKLFNQSNNVSDDNAVDLLKNKTRRIERNCQVLFDSNSTQSSKPEDIVTIYFNTSGNWTNNFSNLVCEKIFDIFCNEFSSSKESECLFDLTFTVTDDVFDGFRVTLSILNNSTGKYFSATRTLLSLKKHRLKLEYELGMQLLEEVGKKKAKNHFQDVTLANALTAALASVAIAALLSMVFLIVWQQWRRQYSGEWVVNKPLRDKFDALYFENKGYYFDERPASSASVLHLNDGSGEIDSKIVISAQLSVHSMDTFATTTSADDACLVPKDMMEMFEKSFVFQTN